VFVSQAINVEEGSLDGEVNSHNAWPSEDGSIVVESEEDFSVFASEDAFPARSAKARRTRFPAWV
jgi:hypothetical protein